MNVTQMLLSLPTPAPPKKVPPKKRNTEKGKAERKADMEKWFDTHMGDQILSTTQIASKRGQDSSTTLTLLKELESDGYIYRTGRGVKVGRGQTPILWQLTKHKPS